MVLYVHTFKNLYQVKEKYVSISTISLFLFEE